MYKKHGEGNMATDDGRPKLDVTKLIAELNRSAIKIERLESEGHPCPDAKRQFDQMLEELAALRALRHRPGRL